MATLPAVHVEFGRLDPTLSQERTVNPAKPDERIPAAA